MLSNVPRSRPTCRSTGHERCPAQRERPVRDSTQHNAEQVLPSAHSREKSSSTQHRRARRLRELRTRVCRVGQVQRKGPSRPEAQDPHSVRAQCTQSAAGQQLLTAKGTRPTAVDRLTVQSISPLIPCGPAGSWRTVQRDDLRAPDLPRCAAGASAGRSGVRPPYSPYILFGLLFLYGIRPVLVQGHEPALPSQPRRRRKDP